MIIERSHVRLGMDAAPYSALQSQQLQRTSDCNFTSLFNTRLPELHSTKSLVDAVRYRQMCL